MPVITISRQMCSYGDEIASALSEKLGCEVIGRNKLLSFIPSTEVSPFDLRMLEESVKYYQKPGKTGKTFLELLSEELHAYSSDRSVILVGFGSQTMFAKDRDAVHIRIIAPKQVRIERARKLYRVSVEEAEKILARADRKHKKFVTTLFDIDLDDPSNYHLTLNTASSNIEECTAAIMALSSEHEMQRRIEMRTAAQNGPAAPNLAPIFKNPAESEFARILDMYQIDWKYEPKTFPIEWDTEGNVTMAFSPDFYLTKFDTYIELTTMNQKYVTIKNKKAKKLRELYPGTNIKIVYKKDFHSLVERFNLNQGA